MCRLAAESCLLYRLLVFFFPPPPNKLLCCFPVLRQVSGHPCGKAFSLKSVRFAHRLRCPALSEFRHATSLWILFSNHYKTNDLNETEIFQNIVKYWKVNSCHIEKKEVGDGPHLRTVSENAKGQVDDPNSAPDTPPTHSQQWSSFCSSFPFTLPCLSNKLSLGFKCLPSHRPFTGSVCPGFP